MTDEAVKEQQPPRPKTTTEKDSVFRGTWQPTIYKPVFGTYQFLPTPPPQEPKKKAPLRVEEKPKVEEGSESPRKKVRDDEERERMKGKSTSYY